MKSPLEKMEETVNIFSSITLDEAGEIPEQTAERLALFACLSIANGISNNPTLLASVFLQVFILGQRSTITVPDWED